MKFWDYFYGILKDWYIKGHQRWQNEQKQKQLQQLHAQAAQTSYKLAEELAMVFRGRSYLGLLSAKNTEEIRFQKYFLNKNKKIIFLFSMVKDLDFDLPVSDLKLIQSQMNQDIVSFKEKVCLQEGEEILAGFFPCLYWGACVARVANSPRSERELLLYVI